MVSRESLARKIAERQHSDSVADSTRSMVPDEISSENDGRPALCVFLGKRTRAKSCLSEKE